MKKIILTLGLILLTGCSMKVGGYNPSYLTTTGNFLGTWDSLATSSFLSTYSDFKGTWDGLATTSFLSTYSDFKGTWDGLATTSFMTSVGDFKGTWDSYATTSFLLKSASTTIPGYLTTTGDFHGTWDSYTTTTLPYIPIALASNNYLIGNGIGQAEATTTINLLTKAFTVASSTYLFTSSSTIPLGYQFYNDTWSSLACQFIGGSSPTGHITCGDGTNWMQILDITGTMASTSLTINNILQVRDLAQCQLEAVNNAPDLLTCNISYRRN